MKDRNFQTRLIGIALGAFGAWIVLVIALRVIDWILGAADSGPMFSPSDWK